MIAVTKLYSENIVCVEFLISMSTLNLLLKTACVLNFGKIKNVVQKPVHVFKEIYGLLVIFCI